MKEPRWLVPCTAEGDVRAVEAVVQQAHVRGATVVAVSLFSNHLERLSPSADFLESVERVAARAHVRVECHIIIAVNVTPSSLKKLIYELHCRSIVLVTGTSNGVFLAKHEVRNLFLGGYSASLVLIRLSEAKHGVWLNCLGCHCVSWLRSWHTWREENGRKQNALHPEKECAEQRMTEQYQHERLM